MVKYTEPSISNDELPKAFDSRPLPNGKYIARISEIEEREGKNGAYWNVRAEVISPDEHAGRVAFGIISFSTNDVPTAKRRRALKALGYPEIGPDGTYELDCKDGEGKVVEIDVKQETYEGKTSAKVNEILPVPEGAEVPDSGIPF